MNADKANGTVDAARRLQRALYRAAKASAERRFHALTGMNRFLAQGSADSGAVKDLGKLDEGEPHVRIDEGRLETGLGVEAQRLQPDAWTALDQKSHRASLLLYPSLRSAASRAKTRRNLAAISLDMTRWGLV